MITGNKGEWSEVYALLKILADKEINAGDGDLNKIENLIFPVIKILRDESGGSFEFSYENNIVIIKNDNEVFRISTEVFKEQAHSLLTVLQGKTERTFSVPEIEEFLNSINSHAIKAKSSIKSDIRIIIHDQRTGTNPELGFSIKSKLGSPSTLLNAGKTTNFVYKLTSVLTSKQINEINQISTRSKIKDRIEKLINLGIDLEFVKLQSTSFQNNLVLIDSSLPNIVSKLLLLFFSSDSSKMRDLTEAIALENPLNYNVSENHPFYSYKIKRFLSDIALGMMPSKVWTGKLDATGGYLIIKEDGEILCYHIYNQNEFEDYLYKNTKFETASSSRHDFGSIYEKDGENYFNLNLQIRFL